MVEQGSGSGGRRGNPPAEHRFKKGFSGNPKGRPKKVVPNDLPDLTSRAAVLREADRIISVRDEGKQVEVSVEAAVTRALVVKALNGNAHAQRTFLQFAMSAREQAVRDHARLFGLAIEVKAQLEAKLREWKASGSDVTTATFHPDDIEIDFATGTVTNRLPFTEELRTARRNALDFRDELLERLAIYDVGLAEAMLGPEHEQPMLLFKEMVAEINAVLAPRFRKSAWTAASPLPLLHEKRSASSTMPVGTGASTSTPSAEETMHSSSEHLPMEEPVIVPPPP